MYTATIPLDATSSWALPGGDFELFEVRAATYCGFFEESVQSHEPVVKSQFIAGRNRLLNLGRIHQFASNSLTLAGSHNLHHV